MAGPLTVEEALARVLAGAEAFGSGDCERVAIESARGRVTAEPITARDFQPPFDASAMDGYAVRAADVARLPSRLQVVGEAAAGHPFAGAVGTGEAARIFTGAPLPAGADAIVIQENAKRDGGAVEVVEGKVDPEHVRTRGMDFAPGQVLIAAGARLGPRMLTLAAAAGAGTVSVRRRPRVGVLATGDELVTPGTPELLPGQIRASNHLGIAAMVGEPEALELVVGFRTELNKIAEVTISRQPPAAGNAS